MKKTFVTGITAGMSLDDVFVLADKSLSQKRDGKPYLNLTLADRSGSIKAVMWDGVEAGAAAAGAGDYVQVTGTVSEYRGQLQVVVRALRRVEADGLEAGDFLPATTLDVGDVFDRLVKITRSLEKKWLRELLEAFWADGDFVARFQRAPAAKMMHHAYIGGLAVHCLSMAKLAEKIASHYGGVDRDLLVAGAVLHDVGKVRELQYSAVIDYSDEGRLLSHIVIGLQMIDDKLRRVADVPAEEADRLRHLVVSHHGSQEFGSPEPPKTIEALLLHYIDEIDSKVNAVRDFIAKEDTGGNWTSYHRVLGRHFYLGGSGHGSD
jgi:3'-5' exoribonuclease